MNHAALPDKSPEKLSLARVIALHKAAFESHSAALIAEDAAAMASAENPTRKDLRRAASVAKKKRELTGKAESAAAQLVFVLPCRTLAEVRAKARYLLGKTVWCDFIPEPENVALVLRSLIAK